MHNWEQWLIVQKGMHNPSVCLMTKKLRNIVHDWWGEEVNSGPKRKRKLKQNQEISVQYTRLVIVLPEQNDDDDAANNDVDESEIGERANVQYQV